MSWFNNLKKFMNEEETKVVAPETVEEEVVATPEVEEEVVLKNPVVIDGAVVEDPTKVGVNTATM